MNASLSQGLPDWARRYYFRFQDGFLDRDEMPHRKEAFLRLFRTDNQGMQDFWEQAKKLIPPPTVCFLVGQLRAAEKFVVTDEDMEAEVLLGSLIYSTDDAIPKERVPRYSPPPHAGERLREPARVQARKLAKLLREFFIVTPPRCTAWAASRRNVGSTVERLVVAYGFDLDLDDLNDIYRRRNIEYTSDSKRGWVQRRRASDGVREKVIESARKLAEIGRPEDVSWLAALADTMQALPAFGAEHTRQPEILSQKACPWADWLRVAHYQLRNVGDTRVRLRQKDWAALILMLFDEEITEEQIGRIVRNTPTTVVKNLENHPSAA